MIKQEAKRLVSFTLLLMALLLCSVLGGISHTEKVQAAAADDVHVFDLYSLRNIGLFTDEQEANLEKLAAKYSKERGINFVILAVTYDSGNYSYSDDPIYYDTLDCSEKFYGDLVSANPDYKDTVLFTINITDPNNSYYRYADVSGQGAGKEKMDNERCQTLFNKLKGDLSDGSYYQACEKFLDLAYRYVNVATFMNPDSVFLKLWFQLAVGFGISLIIILILVYHSKGKMTVTGDSYMDDANSKILGRYDRYIRTTTTRTKMSSSSGGRGGGGGGGGGGSHGGGHF